MTCFEGQASYHHLSWKLSALLIGCCLIDNHWRRDRFRWDSRRLGLQADERLCHGCSCIMPCILPFLNCCHLYLEQGSGADGSLWALKELFGAKVVVESVCDRALAPLKFLQKNVAATRTVCFLRLFCMACSNLRSGSFCLYLWMQWARTFTSMTPTRDLSNVDPDLYCAGFPCKPSRPQCWNMLRPSYAFSFWETLDLLRFSSLNNDSKKWQEEQALPFFECVRAIQRRWQLKAENHTFNFWNAGPVIQDPALDGDTRKCDGPVERMAQGWGLSANSFKKLCEHMRFLRYGVRLLPYAKAHPDTINAMWRWMLHGLAVWCQDLACTSFLSESFLSDNFWINESAIFESMKFILGIYATPLTHQN